MTHSIIFKALLIGSLLTSAYSAVSLADQKLSDQKAMDAYDDALLVTPEQQHRLETKMLSWQENLTEKLQDNRVNKLITKEITDFQEGAPAFSIELDSVRDRIVQN